MTRLLSVLLACLWTTILWATIASAEQMRMTVTTSFHNSGLADVLLPEIKADLGLDVQLLVVGTGQALRLGRAGDVDAILVHSRAAEEQFVADGFASHRREIMYNDFVLIGPSGDPAGLAGAPDIGAALAALAAQAAPFVSRGDDSGTHRRERSLWALAGLDPDTLDPAWYREAGAGMGATLNTAAAMGAHVLSDRASWLNFGNRDGLAILFQGDANLFNQYAYLPISAARHPHARAGLSAELEAWLTSDKAQALIGAYAIGGQTLFIPNATADGDPTDG